MNRPASKNTPGRLSELRFGSRRQATAACAPGRAQPELPRHLAQLVHTVSLTGRVDRDVIALLTYYGYTNTVQHCQLVAAEAERLAVQFGADAMQARVAGWLHDVSALFPTAQRVSAARELELEILPEEERAPMLLHQKLSAAMAREVFNITDQAILSAIECHTTLKAGASLLDKVVFVADKIAWDQPGAPPYLQEITHALERSLDRATYCYLRYLWQQRATLAAVHPWFVRAYHEMQRQT
jgi:predicted HD superfamily hydrolase involved in NAD metabolism